MSWSRSRAAFMQRFRARGTVVGKGARPGGAERDPRAARRLRRRCVAATGLSVLMVTQLPAAASLSTCVVVRSELGARTLGSCTLDAVGKRVDWLVHWPSITSGSWRVEVRRLYKNPYKAIFPTRVFYDYGCGSSCDRMCSVFGCEP